MHQYVSTVEEEPDHLSRRAAGPLTAGSIHLTLEDMFSGWKSIAVFLDDSPKGEKIGKCAAALAHRCRAHLIGIHGMSCNPAEHPSDSFARGKEAIDRVFARLREAEEQKALAVDASLQRLLRSGVSAPTKRCHFWRLVEDDADAVAPRHASAARAGNAAVH